MYSTCLFCHCSLGSNDAIEHCPVGSRLAFDVDRGRLWLICRACGRWNLTPIEERGEAIEECERLFRMARPHTFTEHISFAKPVGGPDLVRIGRPGRLEFAAWRFGDQLQRRRTLALSSGVALVAGVAAPLAGAAVFAGVTLGVASGAALAFGLRGVRGAARAISARKLRHRVVWRVPSGGAAPILVRGGDVQDAELLPSLEPARWVIRLPHARGALELSGDAALQAVRIVMPHLNHAGATRRQVAAAVDALSRAGEPAAYLDAIVRGTARMRRSVPEQRFGRLGRLTAVTRLALEMASQEAMERIAMEGELAALEDAWREAEEIAAIADDLLPPSSTAHSERNGLERLWLRSTGRGEPVRRPSVSRARETESAPAIGRPTIENVRDRLQTALAGTYSLQRELGRGGSARVFAARELRLGRTVAIKVLNPELTTGVPAQRFEREMGLAACLQHPHIVAVFAAGLAAGLQYYTMPLVEGETLRARLKRGVVPLVEALRILSDIALALEYAHARGVVHRDIKPANVLLANDIAMVADFGIAKALTSESSSDLQSTLTGQGVFVGTPAYMAPEQAAAEQVDHRADLYSWGVLAYEMLAGRHPFAEKTNVQALIAAHMAAAPPLLEGLRPGLPPRLVALVGLCLAKEPTERPRSASVVLVELEAMACELAARDGGWRVEGSSAGMLSSPAP